MNFPSTRRALARYDKQPWKDPDSIWPERNFAWCVRRSFQEEMGDGDNPKTTEKYFAMSVDEIRRIITAEPDAVMSYHRAIQNLRDAAFEAERFEFVQRCDAALTRLNNEKLSDLEQRLLWEDLCRLALNYGQVKTD
jgi:hypothetical protein